MQKSMTAGGGGKLDEPSPPTPHTHTCHTTYYFYFLRWQLQQGNDNSHPSSSSRILLTPRLML